jgi:hypothetical protein
VQEVKDDPAHTQEEQMRIFYLFIIGCAVVMMSTGCAPTRTEMDFGTSYKLSKFNQIMNPQAEKDLTPVQGVDGQAADKAIEKYRKDFEKPAPTPNMSISVSGKY